MFRANKLGSNEEVIDQVGADFGIKAQTFHRRGIEKLEKYWRTPNIIERDYWPGPGIVIIHFRWEIQQKQNNVDNIRWSNKFNDDIKKKIERWL